MKITIWSIIGGVVAFLIVWFWSTSQSFAVRLSTALLCSGGGFVTGALLSLVIVADEPHDSPESTLH